MWDQSSPGQEDLVKTLDVQNDILDHFRVIWREDYLLSLRENSRNLYSSSWVNRIKVGQIVLIKTPNKSRPFWSLGRVLQMFVGSDGKVRSVVLKRGDGREGHYSICHLYPLELSITHPVTEDDPEESSDSEDVADIPSDTNENVADIPSDTNETSQSVGRPTRKAAQRCRDFIRDNLANL